MFLAEFARKKVEEEKKPTLRQRIMGTTNAGKAFRVGALASGVGLVGLALANKGKLAGLKKPKEFFTDKIRKGEKTKGFYGTNRKVKWGKVGKIGAIGAGVVGVPVGAAYVMGDDKDRSDVEKRINKVRDGVDKISRTSRQWSNTLHRVSR